MKGEPPEGYAELVLAKYRAAVEADLNSTQEQRYRLLEDILHHPENDKILNILNQPYDRALMIELAGKAPAGKVFSVLTNIVNKRRVVSNPTNSTVLKLYNKNRDRAVNSCLDSLIGTTSIAWAEIYLHKKGIIESTPYAIKVAKGKKLKQDHPIRQHLVPAE